MIKQLLFAAGTLTCLEAQANMASVTDRDLINKNKETSYIKSIIDSNKISFGSLKFALQEAFININGVQYSPLGYALLAGSYDSAKYIIEQTGSIFVSDKATALGTVMLLGEYNPEAIDQQGKLIDLLIKHGDNINGLSFLQQTPIEVGNLHGAPLENIKKLYEQGGDINKNKTIDMPFFIYKTYHLATKKPYYELPANPTLKEYGEASAYTDKLYEHLYKIEDMSYLKGSLIAQAVTANRKDILDYYLSKGVTLDEDYLVEEKPGKLRSRALVEAVKVDDVDLFMTILPMTNDLGVLDTELFTKELGDTRKAYLEMLTIEKENRRI